MKKVALLALATLLTAGATYACDGHGKTAKKGDKKCSVTAKKGGKKACCAKDGKSAKTATAKA